MRKKFRSAGTGSRPSSRLDHLLASRIEKFAIHNGFPDVDEIVHHLQSTYSEYRRYKFAVLQRSIAPVLQKFQMKDSVSDNVESKEDSSLLATPSKKRNFGRDFRKKRGDDGSSCSDDGTVDPESDLMKKLIRQSYTPKPIKEVAVISQEGDVVERDVQLTVDRPAAIAMQKFGDSDGHAESGLMVEIEGRKEKAGPFFRDLGGIKHILDELVTEVILPLCNLQLHEWLGVSPLKGILLHGPPGSGKTKLAHAIANEAGVPFYGISATEVVSGVSGESEKNIRNLFSKAYKTAPSIIFIDEIDVIASKRENSQREMEKRIVAELLTCMGEANQSIGAVHQGLDSEPSSRKSGHVLVIGATNRPDALDAALRRPGRFDREISLGVPDESAREEILFVLARNLRLEGSFDMKGLAKMTPGFVGADLVALVNKAGELAIKRMMVKRKYELRCEAYENEGEKCRSLWKADELEGLSIAMADFEEAVAKVQPSSKREGFSSIPEVTWKDVGGVQSLRREFEHHIVRRIKHPEDYERFGMNQKIGILLFGPPGCGKTLIAQAVANEAGANFIYIKGPELLSKYVGESESQIRTIFSRARTCAPCIIFFDEVDALTTNRGNEGGWVVERLVTQLLAELNGVDQRGGVYVIGATNRLDMIDKAMLRPGRFGKCLYVPLPNAEGRTSILEALSRRMPVSPNVDFEALSKRVECQNLTGADLSNLMYEAGLAAMEEKQLADSIESSDSKQWLISSSHMEIALKKISRSVSEKEKLRYEAVAHEYGSL